MSGKRLSPDQRELMLGLMRDGLPSQEIADAIGVSTSMVHYYAIRHGIDRSRKSTAPTVTAEAAAPDPVQPALCLGWQADALCTQTDPEIFFPEKGGSTKEAERICRRCPVAAECLDQALANDERFGVWGGVSERTRRRLTHATNQS
ncbi:transcription factor WhiB [Branchiibius hedensis]|uniref:Transcriptional regulator WhiB n=1 Tax=Branchiibius hedensis TaxID=672460 RepID=A0A2Y9BNU3_9MICO|nr:WhiB family transcriptional regulator [Branchiibius hedensis]PWJ23302.1 transcription factor WhiB [Branchiibius hedensis]SSA58991.1 Transcription factor WhiB [Branchiibius hedensis]